MINDPARRAHIGLIPELNETFGSFPEANEGLGRSGDARSNATRFVLPERIRKGIVVGRLKLLAR